LEAARAAAERQRATEADYRAHLEAIERLRALEADRAEREQVREEAGAIARLSASAEADVRLEQVRVTELRAAEDADLVRRIAADDAAAARLRARGEIVRMLDTAREERRRADAAAASTREGRDREAAARYVALVAEVAALEQHRDLLRTEIDLLSEPVGGPRRDRLDVSLRRFLGRHHLRPRSVRAR
jgi:hypothetical protein